VPSSGGVVDLFLLSVLCVDFDEPFPFVFIDRSQGRGGVLVGGGAAQLCGPGAQQGRDVP
jgi:hypothetical protein